jgi:hypothetical protein
VLVNIINFIENFLRHALTVEMLYFLTMFVQHVATIKESKLLRLKLKLNKQLKLNQENKCEFKKAFERRLFYF